MDVKNKNPPFITKTGEVYDQDTPYSIDMQRAIDLLS